MNTKQNCAPARNTTDTTPIGHNETREVKRWKAVAYAYPTSENATQFGFGKDGCYVVEVSTSKYRAPRAIAGFATSPEAFAFADTLTDHELSQWSVSPEFRVYTPLGSPTNIGMEVTP